MMIQEVIKKYIVLAACFVVGTTCINAQKDTSSNALDDTISQRIILIGDAGQLTNGRHPVVDAVKKHIKMDKKTTVLFLGDNLYKVGLPDDQYDTYIKARAVLDSQLSIADSTEAQVLMIPGNHDWENGGRGGYDAVIREQLYVDFLAVEKKNKIKFQPEDGCPGPVEVKLGDDVALILFDSQWWLHPHDKPGIESDCNCKTNEELITQIEDLASKNSRKLVILACHHPFKSNGPHGGFFTWKQHIFPLTDMKPNLYIPLPIIGSIYPIERAVFGTPQDVNHPVYQNMVNGITDVVKAAAPNVLFVAGHEHNLQHIKDSNYHYIVSGGGCKDSRVSKSKKSLYINEAYGFAVLEVSKNKNVTLDFYTVLDSVKKDYTATLLNFSKIPEIAVDSANLRPIEDPFLKYKDTVTISASDRFPVVAGMKKFFMGQNYRREWSQPVNMRVFNLSKEMGGFEILSLGGGKQTTSLRLVNKANRKEYVLRNIAKNPTRDIPEGFQGTFAADMVAELNSAAHPYAAFVVPGLARPMDIPVARPQLFFVPDDPALGFYRILFKNTVCMLEERHATLDSTESQSTAKLFNKMLEENDHRPIQPMVLQARMLDILLADYARHFDQWRWGVQDTGKGKIYYPIPRDRDQALFYSDGVLLGIVSGRIMPFLKGFRHDIPRVKWLGYSARDFDRFFLASLDKEQWEKSITDLQQDLSDSVIRRAVLRLPPEIFAIDGETIIKKLIRRRNLLSREGIRYYNFLSRQVNVVGSNEKEYFKVSHHEKGLQIRVYALTKGKDTSFIMYDRVFNSAETKEIRLFGLHDDDIFDIEENASSRIKLRIIGGKGNDTFDIRGNVENLLYDLKRVEGNVIKNESRTKNRFSDDPPVNERNILGFEYDRTRFPQFALGFNTDDALMGGTGITKRTYGFRNLPYATDQRLAALWAVNRKAFQLRYHAEINHITRLIDLVINADYSTPALRNFFGIGNKTTIDPSRKTTYYQTRYNALHLEAMLRRRYFDKFHIQFGPYFFMYNARYSDNADNILGKFRELGIDSSVIFSRKSYVGGKLALVLDNRNNELFPTRGMLWTNEVVMTKGMGHGAHNFTSYTTDMKVYASLSEPAKLVAVLKMGGGRIYSKNFEYFQAMNFGANNALYSFRKNRYAGRGSIYGSLEMRVKIADVDSYILPGILGFTGSFDIGRIYHKPLPGKGWHTGFGAGLYYIPFNLFVITATTGFSEGENVFNFSLGTRINFTF